MSPKTLQVPEFLHKPFFDNTPDGLAYCQMIFDSQGHPVDFVYIWVNKNFEKVTGLGDVVGKKVTELVPGICTSNPELFEIYERVSLTGEAERLETCIKPLARWFLVSVFSPRKNFFVAVFQNTTDRKQIEEDLENAKVAARNVLEDLQVEKETLAHAKAKDEAMLASIGDGVIVVDPAGKITIMNQSAQSLLGWKSREIVGKLLFDVVSVENEKGDQVPVLVRPTAIALAIDTAKKEGKEPVAFKTKTTPRIYYVRKDKTRFPVAVTAAPVILENKVVGAIEVFRDVAKEEEIDKAKTEFVSLASHQLRTPLSTISWYTEMLLAGDAGKLADKQRKYLDEVYCSNRRMVELVDALLNVSRLELGTFVVEPKPTDVIELSRAVVDEQKPAIEAKKLKLSEKYAAHLPQLNFDPTLLHMVVQNILSNAVKYTPEKGKVALEVALSDTRGHVSAGKGQNMLIKVSDTGYGIPKNQQAMIFTKLFRADNVKERDNDGTGLGLYIVKSIIERSGGKVWFESEEDKGTVFYVTLPLVDAGNKEVTKTPPV